MKISWISSTWGFVGSRLRSRHVLEIFLHLPQYKPSSPIYQLWHIVGSSYYSCGLSTATIEYSSACVCVCVSVSTITQKTFSQGT